MDRTNRPLSHSINSGHPDDQGQGFLVTEGSRLTDRETPLHTFYLSNLVGGALAETEKEVQPL